MPYESNHPSHDEQMEDILEETAETACESIIEDFKELLEKGLAQHDRVQFTKEQLDTAVELNNLCLDFNYQLKSCRNAKDLLDETLDALNQEQEDLALIRETIEDVKEKMDDCLEKPREYYDA